MKNGKENNNKSDVEVAEKPKSGLIALKDFHIFCPPKYDIKIKKGENIPELPEEFIKNLITEGVLKGK